MTPNPTLNNVNVEMLTKDKDSPWIYLRSINNSAEIDMNWEVDVLDKDGWSPIKKYDAEVRVNVNVEAAGK